MVFTSASLAVRKYFGRAGVYSAFYKKEEIYRMTGHLMGRERNVKKLARRKADLDLGKQTRAIRAGIPDREQEKYIDLKLAAACGEHRVSASTFMEGLARMSVQLDKNVLINLSIYEPRTFESLALMSKQYAVENGHEFDDKSVYIPPPPEDSIVLDERVDEIPDLIKRFK